MLGVGLSLFLLSLFTTSLAGPPKSDTGFRLTMDEGQGRVIQAFADGAAGIVAVQIYQDGELIHCHAQGGEEGKDAVAFFFYESASGRSATKAVTLPLDMERMARKCRKFLRNQKKKSDEELSEAAKIAKRLRLGFEGTNWCGHYPRSNNASLLGSHLAEDACCRAFHGCMDSIRPLIIHYFLWNYYPYPVSSCNCAHEFSQCLTDANTPFSRDILQTYETGRVPCYTVSNSTDRCLLWDEWSVRCEEHATDSVGSFTDFSTYLKNAPPAPPRDKLADSEQKAEAAEGSATVKDALAQDDKSEAKSEKAEL